jgi:hypothetical protein
VEPVTVVALALVCLPAYVVAAILLSVGFGRACALYRRCRYAGEPDDWWREELDG